VANSAVAACQNRLGVSLTGLTSRLLIIVLAAFIPALAFQIYTETQAHAVRQQLTRDEGLRLLLLVRSEQQRIVEGAEQVLSVIANSPAVRAQMPEDCRPLLADFLKEQTRYIYADVMTLDGTPFCTPAPIDKKFSGSDRAYFRHALQSGGFAVGEYALGRLSGAPSLHFARPFRDRNGEVAGVVEIALSLEWLNEQIAKVDLPPDSILAIGDRNGVILARKPDGMTFVGRPLPPDRAFLLDGDQIQTFDGLPALDTGRPKLVTFSPPGADPNGLIVVVSLDEAAAFTAIARADQVGLALILAGTLLALSLTVALGRRLIRRPVAELIDVADQWRAGALGTRTGLRHRRDEFGRLANTFDNMAETLEARERDLRENEALFRAAFEQAAVGMVVINTDDATIRVNDKLCEMTGYTREELLGRDATDLAHPDERAAGTRRKAELLAGERDSISVTKRWQRKDGSVIWVNLNASVLRGANDRPNRIFTVAEDVTERKRIETALQNSAERLRLSMDAARLGIRELDLVKNEARSSPEAARILGVDDQGDTSFNAWISHVHPEDRDQARAEWSHALADPSHYYEAEFRYRQPDGSWRWIGAYGRAIFEDGRPVRGMVVIRDISNRRRIEEELRTLTANLEARVREEVAAREAALARAAQAERLQALGQLAGGIAHDINNVLQAVAGSLALIQRRPADEAVLRRYAQLGVEATERGASITARLLTFGRRSDLRTEALELASLLAGVQEILSHTLGPGIEVLVMLPADLPPVAADKGQLETALINLATNARDALPHGGRLIFSAETESVGSDDPPHPAGLNPGAYVKLEVTDTGTGMDAATLARAREPFFTTKKAGAGTGLGLPMALGFAEQSGGAMTIDSHLGTGTTVTLWLPLADAGPVAHVQPRPPAVSNHAPARVLLVDDEDLIREVLADRLADAGYTVLVAANGAEALGLLVAGEVVDLLLTDLSMPGMDGLTLIREAQEHNPYLPALLLTGYAGDAAHLVRGGSFSGPVGLLRKPASDVQLLDRIEAMLSGRMADAGRRD